MCRSTSHYPAIKSSQTDFQMKMEDMPLSGPDNTKLDVSACAEFFSSPYKRKCQIDNLPLICVSFTLQALVHDIYSELVEDACLGLCFEVHRSVKQGYFLLDETDQESMKEFGRCLDFHFSLFHFLFRAFARTSLIHHSFQKSWISREWTYLAKCTISGKTKSASVRTAKD